MAVTWPRKRNHRAAAAAFVFLRNVLFKATRWLTRLQLITPIIIGLSSSWNGAVNRRGHWGKLCWHWLSSNYVKIGRKKRKKEKESSVLGRITEPFLNHIALGEAGSQDYNPWRYGKPLHRVGPACNGRPGIVLSNWKRSDDCGNDMLTSHISRGFGM